MYRNRLPEQTQVLVLGGGIHGVGILHDLASRGWKDIHLIEKARLGNGTSSKSTKLIHGGLRYLQHIRDFPLVSEALHERALLLELAGDLVKPLEIIFPLVQADLLNRMKIKAGLSLYDLLAGRSKIARHKTVSSAYVRERVPIFATDKLYKAFSFWDGQTDDLALVQRVAASAAALGAGISEGCKALRVQACEDGWLVDVASDQGELHTIKATYVLNLLGPWSNILLEQSGLTPHYLGLANKGIHLVLPDRGLQAGLIMQTLIDDRIFFMLPWMGHTLLGTTESLYAGDFDNITVEHEEVRYLLNAANHYLARPFKEQEIRSCFAGLRWLPATPGENPSTISREHVIGEHTGGKGLLFTLYGGKLTTYRSLAKIIGNRITRHAGAFVASTTHLKSQWIDAAKVQASPPSITTRFGVCKV